ncbi:MAG: ABC transporter permease [Saprospiraceae bacterium]
MRYYFKLQHTLLNRHIIDFGLPPWAGYLLGFLLFIGLSVFLFIKVDLADYIYGFIAMGLVLNHGNVARNECIKSCYSKSNYLKIRLIENVLIAAPFLAFLLFKQCYLAAGLLAIGAAIAAFVNFSQTLNYALPTPFYKTPFEFIQGFRSAFLLVFFAYFLTLMSIKVDNFSLGIFSLLLVFLISLSFYSSPEDKFYVWIYNFSPKQFLLHKVKAALLHATMLCLPITVSLWAFYQDYWWAILAVQGLGYLYLTCIVLSKYLNFPHKLNLPQSIVIGLGLWFPPLLLGIIPFFYTKSVKKLKEVLG